MANHLKRAIVTEETGNSFVEPKLSNREKQLIELVARGLPNKQIAFDLGISEPTVKFYLREIYRKVGGNRHQLIRLAVLDHERIQAIRLSQWLKTFGSELSESAYIELNQILAEQVSDIVKKG